MIATVARDAVNRQEGAGGLAHRLSRMVQRIVGADVRRGEWRLVLLFFANLFFLLSAYYILKVIREPLILVTGGAVRRSYARGVQAGLLALVIPLYSVLANRFEPARLVNWIISSFVVCLTAFFLLGRWHVPVGFSFFVWLGIFSTLSVAQFWSLAADVMTDDEGHRLFPMIAAGGAIGGIGGAQFAARAGAWLGPTDMMLVAAALLAGCALLTHAIHAEAARHRRATPAARSEPRDPRGGFTLILRDRYLLLIAVSVLLLNLVNTTGDYILAELVNAQSQKVPVAGRAHFIAVFYGNLQTWVSVLTALAQTFVVSRVFAAVGVGRALFFLPLVAVTGYGASAFMPALALVAAVKVVENSTDYSLQNTVQQALFLLTSRDAKYKAKSAVDTMSVRLGDLASTGLVYFGARAGLSTFGFAMVNVTAGIVWLWTATLLRRRREVLAGAPSAAETPRQPAPASPPTPTTP